MMQLRRYYPIAGWRECDVGIPLVRALCKDFGVERLSKIPFRDYMERAVYNGDSLEQWSEAFDKWFGDERPTPKPRDGETFRPIVMGGTTNVTNELEACYRFLLACDSVALLISDSGFYYYRLFEVIYHLEDLIWDESIELFPMDAAVGWSDTDGAANAEKTKFSSAAILAVPRSTGEKWEQSRIYRLGEIGLVVDAIAAYPDCWDIASFCAQDVTDLRILLNVVAEIWDSTKKIRGRVEQSHDALHFMPDLARVSLPMEGMPAKYLKDVRESAIFSDWRRALREGISYVNTIDDKNLLDPHSAKTNEFRAFLRAAAERASREASKSKVLRATVTGAGFGIACAAGALGTVIPNPLITGAVGGASFVAGSALEFMRRTGRRGAESMRLLIPSLRLDEPIAVPPSVLGVVMYGDTSSTG